MHKAARSGIHMSMTINNCLIRVRVQSTEGKSMPGSGNLAGFLKLAEK